MKIYLILRINYFSITHEIVLKCNTRQKISAIRIRFLTNIILSNNTYILMISTNQVFSLEMRKS